MKGYIYKIENKINGKYYIGSTCNPKNRMKHHFSALRRGKHHSVYLQNSFNKYGEKAFEFIIIEECDIDDRLNVEQKYLDKVDFSSGECYNVSKNATNCVLCGEENGMFGKTGENNPNYGRKNTKETIELMSLHSSLRNKSEETIKKMSETKRKKFLSGELVAYNKGKHMDYEQKIKLSKLKSIDVICYDLYTGNPIKEYHGAKEASKDTGIDNSSIISCCRGKLKRAGKMIWRYKSEIYTIDINIFDVESRPHRSVEPKIVNKV